MVWNRHRFSERKIPYIQLISVFLILLSFYMNSRILFFSGVVAFAIVYANQLYERKTGDGLIVRMERRRDRFFVNEEGHWELVFKNEGWPILNGRLILLFDTTVEGMGGEMSESKTHNEVSFPFSILKNESKKLVIPFKAKERGMAKIRKLEIQVPNLIGFGDTILEYRLQLGQEALVYPVRVPVANSVEISSGRPGSQFSSYSLFEDRLSPAGTRDYSHSDGFGRIHWKASARTGRLQTKIFDHVVEKGLLICINVSDGYSASPNFEALMSCAADLAYFAYNKQIPISLCLNIRNAGEVPFYYVPLGEGREQLQKNYEILAIANADHATIPYERMLAYLTAHMILPPTIIHGGTASIQAAQRLAELEQKGSRLLQLSLQEDHGILIPFSSPAQRRVSS